MTETSTKQRLLPTDRKMALYECLAIEDEIAELVAANEGLITEEQEQSLILAYTTSMDRLEGLCNWLKKIDLFIVGCKAEEKRISEMRKYAENRIKRCEGWITPFVQAKKKIVVGTHTLSVRKSEAVIVPDDFDDPYLSKTKTVTTPDKAAIKEAIKAGDEVPGCELVKRYNLQRK